MDHSKFDEIALVRRLERMPSIARVAFALCCTTRQKGAFVQYAIRFAPGGQDIFRAAVDRLWTECAECSTAADWGSILQEVEALAPAEDGELTLLHKYADDAVSSLVYTISCRLHGSAQDAAYAARHAYESADEAAIQNLEPLQTGTAGTEVRILKHPIIQRELQRQERDLKALEVGSLMQVISLLKQRAFTESMLSSEDLLK